MLAKALLLLGLLSLPVLGRAQAPTPAPRYYVGLGASLLTNEPFQQSYDDPTLLGPALTVSRYLTPRLALQATVAWQAECAGQRRDATSAAVWLRYALSGPAKRLRVDGLVGATFLNFGLISRDRNKDYHTYAPLTLGPAVRYALTPRLEATVAVPVLLLPDRLTSWQALLNPQLGLACPLDR